MGENQAVLLLNLQTVAQCAHYEEMDSVGQALWMEKNALWLQQQAIDPVESYVKYGAIQAEFGRVAALGMGFASIRSGVLTQWHTAVFQQSNEADLLQSFLDKLPSSGRYSLCAHNGREFAYPYLCRRLLANGMAIPSALQIQGKRPWEVSHLEDTFVLWQFGDRKNYTPLRVLCWALGVKMAAAPISEKEVYACYYEQRDDTKIKALVEAQLINTVRVYARLKGFSTNEEVLQG